MRRFVILRSGGGELANQLWNYASVFAAALHVGARTENPSFFEYHAHFELLPGESFLTKLLSLPFRGKTRRRGHLVNRAARALYGAWARMVRALHPQQLVSSENQESRVSYLPPSDGIALPPDETLYFEGWLFRNPEGMTRHRVRLLEAFRPNARTRARLEALERELSADGRVLMGIHLRQGDYRTFKGGKYLLSPGRMREATDEYLRERRMSPADVRLFVASDGPVPEDVFSGYDFHVSREDAVTDLFMLARTSVILGSDSSFGHFASWYGDIPHLVVTREPMDWSYYAGRTSYFPNKYATLAKL